jgi:hypothetical protein
LINHVSFKKCLVSFGADIETMDQEINAYLDSLHAIVSKDSEVVRVKLNSLERVMNRSVTQVLFSGRRQVTTIDLYLSISQKAIVMHIISC